MVLYCVGVIVGNQTDILLFHKEVEYAFRNFFILYLGITESLSILKHMADFGIKVPIRIVEKLEKYRDNLDVK